MSIKSLSPGRSSSWISPFPTFPETFLPEIKNVEIPLQKSDEILFHDFSKLSPTKVKDIKESELVSSSDLVSQYLSELIASYPAKYKGQVTPETLYGCHLIARKLDDQYNPQNKSCRRLQFIRHDYFGIISYEQKEGRTLVAMDKDWILSLVAKYIQENKQIGSQRPEMLREYLATLHPVTHYGIPYTGWETKPKFTPVKSISLEDLSIYKLNDPQIGYISNQDRWDQYDDSVMMIFAPIDVKIAQSINSYIYRQEQYFSAEAYLTIENLLLAPAKDFAYLFPVKMDFIHDRISFSSPQMSRSDLVSAFYHHQVSRKFPRLDPKLGCYATYLLAEATFYNFPIQWENSILTIGNCGYIQAQDLFEHFGFILNDIRSEGVQFQKISNFETCFALSSTTDIKCFLFDGDYYAAVPDLTDIEELVGKTRKKINLHEVSLVELRGPLNFGEKYPIETKKYLEQLGYSVNESNNEIIRTDIKLGYRTYSDDKREFTVYYYLSTHEEEIDLHESEGRFSQELFDPLEKLLQEGYFFSQRMKNILLGYPDFIPGYMPVRRGLSVDPKIALEQIKNMELE